MKTDKAWSLALGFFLGASLSPAAKGQDQRDQQKETGNFVAQKSQDQNDSASKAKSGQNSNDAGAKKGQDQPGQDKAQQEGKNSYDPSSKQKAGQPGQDKSNGQQGKGTQRSDLQNSKDQQAVSQWWNYPSWSSQGQQGQNLEHLLASEGQGWIRGTGPQSELHLVAADESVREHLSLPSGQGVVVLWVAPVSGAASAGIQQNDILLTLGEAPLAKPEDLYDRLKQAGEKPVPLALLRSGGRITLQVQPLIRVTLRPVTVRSIRREYWIGLGVTPIEPVLRTQLQLSPNLGVIVNQVIPDGPAAKAGIALHEIIVAVDGDPISDPSELASSVQAKGTKPITLKLVVKGGKLREVTVTPERKKPNEAAQLSGNSSKSVTYDVVRPGVVLDYTTASPYQTATDPSGAFLTNVPLISNLYPESSKDGSPVLNKRLDSLDSDLKELRKLVEELQKTATRIIEQHQK